MKKLFSWQVLLLFQQQELLHRSMMILKDFWHWGRLLKQKNLSIRTLLTRSFY
ncbi:hypothetical protein [Niabella hibiscisoli]|uniref:hypothetical protein n=1 Tax=Niabella hibiscisoli TaxID=1825928 RepID=UPI001F0F7633|nr:hypothetical protein [Niabella hibiscisoli]MCH5719761.1 hypothetical protein [Niabella hibiscisoli]